MIGKSDITDALVSVLASNWRQRVRRIGWEEPLLICILPGLLIFQPMKTCRHFTVGVFSLVDE